MRGGFELRLCGSQSIRKNATTLRRERAQLGCVRNSDFRVRVGDALGQIGGADFVSTHAYLVTPFENDSAAHAQSRIDAWGTFYDTLRLWIDTNFADLTDQGYPIARQLRLVVSEYNERVSIGLLGQG